MKLFDLHCDTLYECYKTGCGLGRNRLHIDLERGLSAADMWGQAFAVWMPDELRGEDARQQCHAILEMAYEQSVCNSDKMTIVTTPEQMDGALCERKCAAVLTVEGGSALAGRLDTLDLLAGYGVKLITITWNGSNELGNGCLSDCGDGLTPFGKSAVRRMAELGIVPDVSHLNHYGFWDVMECAGSTVAATHSVSESVYAHPRNLTDEQFAALRDAGGVVGLNLCADQLGEQSFDGLRRHLDRYLSLDGDRTVALGFDLDGTDISPEWGGIQMVESFYEYLLQKQYEEALLERLFFVNSYEFFKKALTNTSKGV